MSIIRDYIEKDRGTAPTAVVDAVNSTDAVNKGQLDSALASVSVTYNNASSNVTAVAKDYLKLDTTTAPITVTLPIAPVENDEIAFLDVKGTFDVNALTIGANGNTIMQLAEDMIVNTKNISFSLIYTNSDWRLI